MIYTLFESGLIDGKQFEDIIQVGPAPDLVTAIMWEKIALNDCKYVTVREATKEEKEQSNAR